jgi:hypothetical protein
LKNSSIWRKASTRYYKTRTQVRGGRSGSRLSNISGCSLHRGRCLPELYNSCNTTAPLLRRPQTRSAQRIAIARRSRAAVAAAYLAMGAGCALLRRFVDSLTQDDFPCGLTAAGSGRPHVGTTSPPCEHKSMLWEHVTRSHRRRGRAAFGHVETRCRNALRSTDGGSRGVERNRCRSVCRALIGRRARRSAFAGRYSLELLPACIRRSRFYTGLCATAGRTVHKRGKAVLRHRVRYVTNISRSLADVAINHRLKTCHTLVLTQ